jgi:hypothetical protein
VAFGICKLTSKRGTFVDSHLLPKALTRPEQPGKPFIEAGSGRRPMRRFSSWYDNRLVTKEGEKILSDLDNWAIGELRKHRLVWSGWGIDSELDVPDRVADTGFGVRIVRGLDGHQMRLFMLSLLWRAAATQRSEFSQVQIPLPQIDQLRDMILSQKTEPFAFFPATLTQLSTRGPAHNHAPTAKYKDGSAANKGLEIDYYRFYFDGLIIHMHKHMTLDAPGTKGRKMYVGGDDELIVCTMESDKSAQYAWMDAIAKEAHEKWPDVMKKLT